MAAAAPVSKGDLTVADVQRAEGAEDHARLVRAWTSSAYAAWSEHLPKIRTWLSAIRRMPAGTGLPRG